MVPLAIQSTIETELAAVLSELALKQTPYFAAHGRYWQGARTHATPPADGIPLAPNLNAKPPDQTASWATLGIALPPLTTAAYTVWAYQSPAGHGYVVHADVLISGVYHRKSVNVGPEAWLTHPWGVLKSTSV
jgi:hypothetical protein